MRHSFSLLRESCRSLDITTGADHVSVRRLSHPDRRWFSSESFQFILKSEPLPAKNHVIILEHAKGLGNFSPKCRMHLADYFHRSSTSKTHGFRTERAQSVNDRNGARRPVPASRSERPLSDQKGDPGRNAEQRARSADSGHSRDLNRAARFDPFRTFA